MNDESSCFQPSSLNKVNDSSQHNVTRLYCVKFYPLSFTALSFCLKIFSHHFFRSEDRTQPVCLPYLLPFFSIYSHLVHSCRILVTMTATEENFIFSQFCFGCLYVQSVRMFIRCFFILTMTMKTCFRDKSHFLFIKYALHFTELTQCIELQFIKNPSLFDL